MSVKPVADSLSQKTPLRIALVGCGAVARTNLMPVLAGHDAISVTTLVDRDLGRARELAEAYGVPLAMTDMAALRRDAIDGVVLATPPAHHARATIDLVSQGMHVFVEKPMAISSVDAEAMVRTADAHRVVLGVGLYRRLLPAVKLLRHLIDSGDFGRPLAVDAEEGGAYGWQLATLDVLTAAAGGGGNLIDIGSHVIDVILYAVPGVATLDRYEDNASGGIETDCVARFNIAAAHGPVAVRLELSRTRELRGSIRVECERGTIELLRGDFTQVVLHQPNRGSGAAAPAVVRLTAQWSGQAPFIGYDAFRAQFDDWLSGITAGRDCELSGRSVVPVVRLIEQCYQHRISVTEPWTEEGVPAVLDEPSVKRKRVLVTGAGGFLGGRAVELLARKYGHEVVAVVKAPKSAARLARWPFRIEIGDVCSAQDMDRVMTGCDIVVHCAVGTSWDPSENRRVTVEGTTTVAEAASRAGVKRFVHISSMAVHQPGQETVVDESVPLAPTEHDHYGRSKRDAEIALGAVAAKGLSTIILRPARIYGPFSKTFTVRPLQALRHGRLAISGDPDVPSNMVYVDNVVHAIAKAIDAPDTRSGQAYLINDAEQLTLREFFNYFGIPSGHAVKVTPARPTSAAQRPSLGTRWIRGLRNIALASELRALVHRVMDTDPVGVLPRRLWNASPNMQRRLLKLFKVDAAVTYRPAATAQEADLEYYGDPAVVSSAKAARELDFTPPVRRERAMMLTRLWAISARLLPEQPPP